MNTSFSSSHRAPQAPRPCFAAANFAAPFRALRAATAAAWLLFCLLFFSPLAAHAATFVVTSIADTGGSTCGTTCTLRQAIGAANANTTDADIITFASNVRGNIDLTTIDDGGGGKGPSALALLGPTDIQGPGADVLNVRGVGNTFRLLRVTSGVNATVSGLTLSGASSPNSGGAIYNDAGSLTLVGCAISGNTAGSFGGGIYSGNAGLTVRNCTISGNTSNRSGSGSGTGGGITSSGSSNGSSLTLSNSTISGNSVPNSNGGGNGGGILADTNLSIFNCTIAGNSAAGGGSASGVISGGSLSINNSIVAANSNNNTQPDIVREAGSVTSGGYNLIGNPGGIAFNGAGDQKGTAATPLNPQIGALANNGGPTQTHALRTGSPAIDAGNSALATDQRGVRRPVDIAGVANVANASDIGAVERDEAQDVSSFGGFVVNTPDDHDDGTCGVGDCTLREAINAANVFNAVNRNAGAAITYDATVFASKQAIKLSQGLLPLINSDITITGPTASGAGVTVDAGGNSGIFGVTGGTSTFSNLTLSGGNNNGGNGGAIQQSGASTLTLNNCTISGNTTSSSGGGISSTATLTLNSCTLSGNTTSNSGGGIYNRGTLTLNSCTLSGNTAGALGGGIRSNGTLTLNSCTLSGNSAGNGGGIFIFSGTFNLSNTIVAGNTAPTNPDVSGTINAGDYNLIGNSQGTIFSGSPSHNLTNVDAKLGPLADNKGPTFTRALLPGSPAIDAGNTTFTTDQRGRVRPFDFAGVANAAGGNGSDIGAFELNETPQSGANFVVNQITDTDDGVCGPTNCTLREAINAAEGNADASTITFDATTFATRQTIALGGTALPGVLSTITITSPAAGLNIDAGNRSGIFAVFGSPSVGDLTLSNLSLSNGNAFGKGGGIRNDGGRVALTNCTLASNSSVGNGGGIYNNGTLTLTNCTLASNSSRSLGSVNGGGISNYGTLTLFNCTLAGNSSDFGGGIFNGGTLNLNNSIVAGNSAPFGGPDIFGPVTSGDYNLVQDTSGAMLSGTHNVTGQDPLLGPLKDNGGPTFTRALLAGSPAIDAGNSALTSDQRGRKRPVDVPDVADATGGNGSDIGAFEFDPPQSGPNFVVNQTDDHDDGTCGTTDCTLREAINAANVAGGAITFDATVFASKQTLTLTLGSLPPFTSNVTVSGPTTPGAGVTVKSQSQSNIVFQTNSGTVTLSALTVTNGYVAVNTRGGNTTVQNCTLNGNSFGIQTDGSGVTVRNCTLSGNTNTGILNASFNNATVTSSTLSGNGVGIRNLRGTTTVSNSIVSGNTADDASGITDGGFNLIGVDAKLGPLKDNGGPTFTFALLAGSPAIDMGSNALIPADVVTDQRGPGYARIVGRAVDIGAYEVQNSAPVAASQSVSTYSSTLINITLNATDAEGDKLTYSVVAQPANGKVTIAGNVATYTSNNGYVGPDSFTFKANDGQLDSNTATVNISVVAGPSPPVPMLVVTTLADIQANDGVTSLREAVDAANRDGADSPITFAVSGTITLTGGELTLVNDGKVSITGPAKGITISGDSKSRVFNISNGADATFSGLNITGGNAGNANGGGILNNGALTLNGSTLFNNAANSGGAIANGGTLTLANSTLAGNSAQNNGGGIFNSPTATMTSLNSTIVGNAATSGGGIFKGKSLTLSNSIVVGNTSDNLSAVADAGGNNITAGTKAAAGLDPFGLRDNGGAVRTIALTTRGTAVNSGDNNAAKDLKTDARGAGFPRVVSSKVDIGAFESAFGNRAPSLNNATFSTSVNVPFSMQLAGTDADGDALTYSRAGGTLPDGITLSSTGLLSGTPTKVGRYDFQVNVFDGTDVTVARFIIVVSDITDGVGPVITRAALNASYTRDEFANIVYRGTVRDVAPNGVTPSGVAQVTFQLRRDSDGFAYSGNETDGFTSNVNLGYFPAFLSDPIPNNTAAARDYRRTFGADGFVPSASVLKPGGYSLVIVAKDVAGNFSVEVVPVTIAAASSSAASAASATSSAPSAIRSGAAASGGAS